MSRITLPPAAIEYPSGDGKPMAENDAQLLAMLYAIGALRVYYRDRADVYVSGDLLMYYEKGNPKASVAPDVFVVFGVEDRVRERYLVWKEGKGPDFVLEVASKSTWREDLGPKREVYARLGVKEYWQYDPTGKYFTPVLQGLRLAGGRLRAPVGGDVAGRRTDPDERDAGPRVARAGRRDALPGSGNGAGPAQSVRGARRPPGGGSTSGCPCRAGGRRHPSGRNPSGGGGSTYRGARSAPSRAARLNASGVRFPSPEIARPRTSPARDPFLPTPGTWRPQTIPPVRSPRGAPYDPRQRASSPFPVHDMRHAPVTPKRPRGAPTVPMATWRRPSLER